MNDDTAAFQRAIGALPSDGGTVDVPAGAYLIDALRSVRLRSRMHLQLAPGAKLIAKPNSSVRSRVIHVVNVEDAEISGGQIIGERDAHAGVKGEWGHGIQVLGASRVTVRNMHVSRCWGDGVYVGSADTSKGPRVPSNDVLIANIVSTGNRRQGLSICGSHDVRVHDSEFSDTSGTSPQCGIDIEPNAPDTATRVHIENCLIRGNAVYGLQAYKRAQDVTIKRCLIENNRSCGVVTMGAIATRILGNTVRNNGSTGVFIQKGSVDCIVRDNTFHNNYTKQGLDPRSDFSMVGVSRRVKKDLLVGSRGVADIKVGNNHYR